MTSATLLSLLRLKFTSGLGDLLIQRLVKHFHTPEAIFLASTRDQLSVQGISKSIIKELGNSNYLTQAEEELARIKKQQIKVLSWLDGEYPFRLKQCVDKPSLLFYKGTITPYPKRIISIVGTRKISHYGRAFLKTLIPQLAPHQPLVVSGLAYGTDALAHQLALDYQLPTYGILAHGLNRIYPGEHASMAKQILEDDGALMTDFTFHTKPDRENFPKRNRIIAGLSDLTLVVESDIKGGSMISARLANDYNREVMALPGNINQKNSNGCNLLIKQNLAHMITSAEDLIKLLDWQESTPKTTKQTNMFPTLNTEEKQIVALFHQNGQLSVDQISLALQKPGNQISVQLLALEMKGVVVALPGSQYKLMQ